VGKPKGDPTPSVAFGGGAGQDAVIAVELDRESIPKIICGDVVGQSAPDAIVDDPVPLLRVEAALVVAQRTEAAGIETDAGPARPRSAVVLDGIVTAPPKPDPALAIVGYDVARTMLR